VAGTPMPFRGAVTPLMSSLDSSLPGSELTPVADVPLTSPCRAGACSVIPLRALNRALTLVESCAARVIHSWCASDAGGFAGVHGGAARHSSPAAGRRGWRRVGDRAGSGARSCRHGGQRRPGGNPDAAQRVVALALRAAADHVLAPACRRVRERPHGRGEPGRQPGHRSSR